MTTSIKNQKIHKINKNLTNLIQLKLFFNKNIIETDVQEYMGGIWKKFTKFRQDVDDFPEDSVFKQELLKIAEEFEKDVVIIMQNQQLQEEVETEQEVLFELDQKLENCHKMLKYYRQVLKK